MRETNVETLQPFRVVCLNTHLLLVGDANIYSSSIILPLITLFKYLRITVVIGSVDQTVTKSFNMNNNTVFVILMALGKKTAMFVINLNNSVILHYYSSICVLFIPIELAPSGNFCFNVIKWVTSASLTLKMPNTNCETVFQDIRIDALFRKMLKHFKDHVPKFAFN